MPKNVRSAGRPPGSDREENMATILRAAIKCFGSRGYAATNFADISQEVGMTRSAIYPYFRNKRELFVAALKSAQNHHYLRVRQIENDALPFDETLRKTLQIFVDDHIKDPDLSTFLAVAPIEIRRHEELAAEISGTESILDVLRALFQKALKNGHFKKHISADDLLLSFLGSVMGMSLLQRNIGEGNIENALSVLLDPLLGTGSD